MPVRKPKPETKLKASTPIAELRNLGPQSARWLQAIDVYTLADLRERGAIACYQQLSLAGYKPSLLLLYAMYASLQNRDWRSVSAEEKVQLKAQLNALDSHFI